MKVVKVTKAFFEKCVEFGTERELLQSDMGRPCVLLVNLIYKGEKHKFVVPFRSNISPTTPDSQFFHLPPNKHTKPKHSHGIHYIKLFPVSDKYINKYLIDGNKYWLMISSIIDKNEDVIITECQQYLKECEDGKMHPMTPDIDGILEWVDK